jgi:hypothetical protein
VKRDAVNFAACTTSASYNTHSVCIVTIFNVYVRHLGVLPSSLSDVTTCLLLFCFRARG